MSSQEVLHQRISRIMQLCCLESKAISHDKALLSKEASTSTNNTKASLAQRGTVNDFFFWPGRVVFVFFRVSSFTQKKEYRFSKKKILLIYLTQGVSAMKPSELHDRLNLSKAGIFREAIQILLAKKITGRAFLDLNENHFTFYAIWHIYRWAGGFF